MVSIAIQSILLFLCDVMIVVCTYILHCDNIGSTTACIQDCREMKTRAQQNLIVLQASH